MQLVFKHNYKSSAPGGCAKLFRRIFSSNSHKLPDFLHQAFIFFALFAFCLLGIPFHSYANWSISGGKILTEDQLISEATGVDKGIDGGMDALNKILDLLSKEDVKRFQAELKKILMPPNPAELDMAVRMEYLKKDPLKTHPMIKNLNGYAPSPELKYVSHSPITDVDALVKILPIFYDKKKEVFFTVSQATKKAYGLPQDLNQYFRSLLPKIDRRAPLKERVPSILSYNPPKSPSSADRSRTESSSHSSDGTPNAWFSTGNSHSFSTSTNSSGNSIGTLSGNTPNSTHAAAAKPVKSSGSPSTGSLQNSHQNSPGNGTNTPFRSSSYSSRGSSGNSFNGFSRSSDNFSTDLPQDMAGIPSGNPTQANGASGVPDQFVQTSSANPKTLADEDPLEEKLRKLIEEIARRKARGEISAEAAEKAQRQIQALLANNAPITAGQYHAIANSVNGA